MDVLKPSEIELKYGISAIRIRRLLKNCPNFLDGVIKKPHAGTSLHSYYIPESEVSRLMFLKRKQKK